MKQERLQLAKEYESQIIRLRKELGYIDRVTFLTLKNPEQWRDPALIPDITRDLNEFPRLKAAIRAALEEELTEYEMKLEKL